MKKNKKSNIKLAKDVILSKFTSGRERGIQKRKKTLLVEYKMQNKSNKFIDHRIGEKNHAMTNDDRIMARFVAQRVRAHSKKQIFNLENDDEVLTHHGLTLQNIEKYDNPQSESDDDEDGKLKADFVNKAHFGGGLFTKVPNSEGHRSTIEQLIAESKRRKAERQQNKEETQTLTDKLDKDLKELFPVFTQSSKNGDEIANIIKPAKESYDLLVRELRFEPVGKPSSKLKSEDQVENEVKQRLLVMENERVQRMKCDGEFSDDQEEAQKLVNQEFQSADSLDDGFDFNVFDEEDSDEECHNDDDSDCASIDHKIIAECDEKPAQTSSHHLQSSKVPTNLAQLKKIVGSFNVAEKIALIENLLRDQQIHCGTSNKEHLMKFFSAIMLYIDSMFTSPVSEDCWSMVNRLSPVLFDLVQLGGDAAAEIVYQKLAEKYTRFSSCEKLNVTEDMIVLLKLIPLLFPTSDYYHSVATPACVFGGQLLSKNACNTLHHIAKGLFVATTILEYVSLSHRFCPEAINFLKNVVYTAAANFQDTCPPIRITNKILLINEKSDIDESLIEKARLPCSFVTEDVPQTVGSKLTLIRVTLKLIATFFQLYENLAAASAIWRPISARLDKLPTEFYPLCLRDAVEELRSRMKSVEQRPLKYLVAERKRPKALRLYEPNIRPIIEGRSLKTVSQAKLERDKLARQYKREMKGALKEIRKDKNFLARVRFSEQAKRDAERKNKVKQIFGWGQNQQTELKKMERKNRFKRK